MPAGGWSERHQTARARSPLVPGSTPEMRCSFPSESTSGGLWPRMGWRVYRGGTSDTDQAMPERRVKWAGSVAS